MNTRIPRSVSRAITSLHALLILLVFSGATHAQSLTPDFVSAGYALVDLGSIPDLPTPYGGLTIKADEPNTLYIGGAANQASGAIYAVPLTRDAITQTITGFAGPAVLFVNAPNNDGGLTFTPSGTLLFTQYPINGMGQVLPDQSFVSTDLTALGVGSSVGSHAFVPAGYPGAGNLILASYNQWVLYKVPFTVDATGLHTFSAPNAQADVSGTASGPEGIAYVPPGSAAFTAPSMVISAYGLGKVVAFEVDADGLPIPSTARDMVTGLTGAEGAWIDPLTGDFLFSTFGGSNRVIRVSGFEAPSSIASDPWSPTLFTVFPNPTQGMVQLSFAENDGKAMVEVIDALGSVVMRSAQAAAPRLTLDLSTQPSCVYAIRVRRDGAEQVRQVVLQ